MAKQKSTSKRKDRGFNSDSGVGDPSEILGSGSARRYLKHLDRHLQRFSNKIDSLEERANRLSNEEEGDLILDIESLHRETLLLRAEIREHLAGAKRSSAEMMEYAEESWRQLKESFGELKDSFEPKRSVETGLAMGIRIDDDSLVDRMDWQEDQWPGDDGDVVISEIHPPKSGPKR